MLPNSNSIESARSRFKTMTTDFINKTILFKDFWFVPGRSSHCLEVFVGNMFVCVRISVVSRKTKIDQVNDVRLLGALQPEKKILRLHISVDEAAVVNRLDPVQQLKADHQGRLQAELLSAQFEQVFQIRSQQFENHAIVRAATTEVMNLTEIETDFCVGLTFCFLFRQLNYLLRRTCFMC
jgi:hypothetical protein